MKHLDNSQPPVVTRTITSFYDRDPAPPNALMGASLGHVVQTADVTINSHSVIDRAFYDIMGRPREQERCIDGSCATLSQTFNLAGQLKTLTYPDGETVTSSYNGSGQLAGLSNYLNAVTYNSLGHPTQLTYANGVTATHGYDPNRFWPESMTVSAGSYGAAYTYDAAGRMRTRTQINPAEFELYEYDDLDRLRKVTSAGPQAQEWRYDPIGNMTFNSKTGTYTYADPAHIHAVTSIAGILPSKFAYDANGNMTATGRQVPGLEQ